jgi:phosphohistidine phosphatase SixA
MATNRNGGRRALVVANEAVAGEELRDSLLRQLDEGTTKVFVVAPALAGSALKHYAGDIDDAIEPAARRLQRTLEQLREAGIEAEGEVGDADPMIAIGDEIEKFHPDQILVVGHRDESGAFAERGLLEQAQRDLELPVTELVVDESAAPHLLGIEKTTAGAGRNSGWRPSANLPPLTAGNVAGIFVAVLGTLVLALLAADCADNGSADIGAACAARILIAIGMALLNLAHVVGLFLFQSVRYEGIWSRFFARLSLIGTPVAIVVSLLLGLFM